MNSRLSRAALVLCGGLHGPVYAQHDPAKGAPPKIYDCVRMEGEPDKQLACFRDYAKPIVSKMQKDHEEKQQRLKEKQEALIPKWKLRDTSTITPGGEYDIGAKPASVQLGTSEGKSISTAKISVFGVLQPINGGPLDTWERFFNVAWDRDISAKTPKDLRQFIVGMEGNLLTGSFASTGQAHLTLRAGHRDDVRSDTRGSFLNANADLYYIPWISGKRGEDVTHRGIYFPVGLLVEKTKSADANAGPEGTRSSLYAGVRFETDLNAILPRLSANASTQWFRDIRVPSGADKRRTRYSALGITYDLVDPKSKTGWVPSLSLARQVGTDPVTGEGPVRKTVFGLGVKFD